MKISADRSKCLSYGNCAAAADDLFDLDDDGLVVVVDSSPSADAQERARKAAALCPVQAITVTGSTVGS